MRSRRAAISAVLIGLSWGLSAQETVTIVDTYCDGEGCPTKYLVEGFEVRVARSVFDAADFSHSQLGQALDTLQGELIAFERMARRPGWNQLSLVRPDRSVSVSTFGFRPHPINQLRTAGVSFYIQSDHHVANAYSNCTGACYISRPNRVVLNIGRLLQLIYTDTVVVHELAHAYHDVALEDGTANACVEKAYETAVTNGGLYATVDNWQPFQEPGTRVHS